MVTERLIDIGVRVVVLVVLYLSLASGWFVIAG
jgi:hypothetical protein